MDPQEHVGGEPPPGQAADPVQDAIESLRNLLVDITHPNVPIRDLCSTVRQRPGFVESLPTLMAEHPEWPDLRLALKDSKAWRYLAEMFRDVREQMQAFPPQEGLPQVVITPYESLVTDKATKIIADRCSGSMFDRGGELVHIARSDDMTVIKTISQEWLRHKLSEHIAWVRVSQTPEGLPVTKAAAPAKWVAGTMLMMPERPMFERLVGVATSPVIRKDGSIVTRNGFDPESGWFVCLPRSLKVDVPEAPTYEQIGQAMAILHDIVRDFPFEQPYHRSTALCYLLTMVARTYFDGPSPLFLMSATTRRAGKDLLIDAMSLIATGHQSYGLTWPGSGPKGEEETEKKIHSAYVSGVATSTWRNIKSGVTFESPTFDKCLTDPTWTGRTLGLTGLVSIPNLMTWSMSGNNPQVGADLAPRTMLCILAPTQEHPEDRQGLRNLRLYIPQHRGKLLSAALTVLRGWINAGEPKLVPDLGSFEGWCCLRSVLVWAGEPDPLAGMQELRAMDDASTEDLEMIHDGFAMAWGLERVTVRDMIERVKRGEQQDQNNPLIHRIRAECLGAEANPSMKIGKMLGVHRGKWHRNRRLCKGMSSERFWQMERRDKEPELDLEPGSGG